MKKYNAEYFRNYNRIHRDKVLQQKAAYKKTLRGRALVNAQSSRRRSRLANRTPVWADQDKIKQIYVKAVLLTEETGIKMHVDHVIPLHGKTVSGLHVPENLQIITARENLSKYNKSLSL